LRKSHIHGGMPPTMTDLVQ